MTPKPGALSAAPPTRLFRKWLPSMVMAPVVAFPTSRIPKPELPAPSPPDRLAVNVLFLMVTVAEPLGPKLITPKPLLPLPPVVLPLSVLLVMVSAELPDVASVIAPNPEALGALETLFRRSTPSRLSAAPTVWIAAPNCWLPPVSVTPERATWG